MSGPSSPARRWLFRIGRSVLIGVGVSLFCLAVIAMAFGDKFVFYPSRFPEGLWDHREKASVAIREVEYSAKDGTKLVAWYSQRPNPRATILFFHGNAGNISDRLDIFEKLGSLNVEVFGVDYRGYGKCDGTPGEKAILADAETAYDQLIQRFDVRPGRIILFGKSLGGGPAVDLATKVTCAGLILQSTFTSVPDVAKKAMPYFPTGWFLATRFDNLRKIGNVSVPKLIIHSKGDEIIPFDHGVRLFEAASQPKWFAEFERPGHNELIAMESREWLKDIAEFVGKCVGD